MLIVDAIFAQHPGRVCYYQTKKQILYILHSRFFWHVTQDIEIVKKDSDTTVVGAKKYDTVTL